MTWEGAARHSTLLVRQLSALQATHAVQVISIVEPGAVASTILRLWTLIRAEVLLIALCRVVGLEYRPLPP